MAAGGAWADDDGQTVNWAWAVHGAVGPYFVELELVEEPRPAQAWACLAKDYVHGLAQVSFHGFGAAEPPIPGLRKGAVLRWRNARCVPQLQQGDLAFVSEVTPEDLPNIRLMRHTGGGGANGDGANDDGKGRAEGADGSDGREVWWDEVVEASPRALLGAYIDVLIRDKPDEPKPGQEWRCKAWANTHKGATDEADRAAALLSFQGSSPQQPPLPGLRVGAMLRWRNPQCLGLMPRTGFLHAPIAAAELGNLRVLEHAPYTVTRGGVTLRASVGSLPRPVPQAPPPGADSRQAATRGSGWVGPRPQKGRERAREQQAAAEPMGVREWAVNTCMALLVVALAVFIYNSG